MFGPYCVYLHRSPSGKVYIGQTCQSPPVRWGKNGEGYKDLPYFWNAIQKYGWDNFSHVIILRHLTAEEANDAEQALIKQHRATNPKCGYNIKPGGNNSPAWNKGIPMTEEQKQLRRKPMSEETKKRISASRKGIRPWNKNGPGPMKGKTLTDEQRAKISESNRKRWESKRKGEGKIGK